MIPAMGTLEIERKAGGYVDTIRKYRVVIDGEQHGVIGRGQTVTFPLEPGTHIVMLKIDWCRSTQLTVEIGLGETMKLWCEPAANPASALWYATFGRKRYIRLAFAER